MHGRFLNLLIVVTRLAAGTVLAPLALVAGMMTIPTTCQCGTEYPHAHALFGIAGHHHGHPHDTYTHDDESITGGQHGVTVQAPPGSALQASAATTPPLPAPRILPNTGSLSTTILKPDELTAAPDVPPPQA